jgi:oxysterol-binding protein-related protein 8
LFNARNAKHAPPKVRPIEEQADNESQKLWLKTCIAIRNSDHVAATDEKTKIEEAQREKAAKRQQEGIEWRPKLFRPVQGGSGGSEEGEESLDWILNANMYVGISFSSHTFSSHLSFLSHSSLPSFSSTLFSRRNS